LEIWSCVSGYRVSTFHVPHHVLLISYSRRFV